MWQMESFLDSLLINCKTKRENQRKPSRSSKEIVRRASNESDTDRAESDMNSDLDFMADSLRHLAVDKIKINRVSDFEKTVPIVIT